MNELEEPSEIEIKQRSKGGVKEKWRTGSETVDCRCRSKQEVTLTLPLLSFDIFTFVVGSFSFLFFLRRPFFTLVRNFDWVIQRPDAPADGLKWARVSVTWCLELLFSTRSFLSLPIIGDMKWNGWGRCRAWRCHVVSQRSFPRQLTLIQSI